MATMLSMFYIVIPQGSKITKKIGISVEPLLVRQKCFFFKLSFHLSQQRERERKKTRIKLLSYLEGTFYDFLF